MALRRANNRGRMGNLDFTETIERFTGFGSHYDSVRPTAPAALAELLLPMARCGRKAELVVDLGSGTGLSTRYWGPFANSVIGIDPTESMRSAAMAAIAAGGDHIQYKQGFSHATGLEDECADIVACGQSLHWMEPASTFREAIRILKPGGVFAAYDYDWPPFTSSWEVDRAYMEFMRATHALEREHGITSKVRRWDKGSHLGRMRDSGCFRHTAEHLMHHREKGNAERIAGIALSQGHVQSLLKLGLTKSELQIDRLYHTAKAAFGDGTADWLWSVRIRVGVK